jgi:hypothetical protein
MREEIRIKRLPLAEKRHLCLRNDRSNGPPSAGRS